MKKPNNIVYILMLSLFSLILMFTFYYEDHYKKQKEITDVKKIEQLKKSEKIKTNLSSSELISKEIGSNLKDPLSIILIQLLVVLGLSRIFSLLFKRIGQPSVIGEIFAGIALGPSLLGLFFPELSSIIFPKESLIHIKVLSQIGLVVFMFIIGMELDVSILRKQASSAIFISHTSIIFPYSLGVILAYFLFDKYAPEGISFLSFGLFMGIAMSITAFPVLARIIQEKGLSKSNLGVLAITCAAVDDISAWCILALIIAIVHAGTVSLAIFTILITLLFILLMLFLIQPLLNRMSKVYVTKEIIGKGVLSSLLFIMISSSLFTEGIGIHALFGAFLAGVIMPTHTKLRSVLTEKFEDFSMIILLPLFFAYTGLRTKFSLLNEWHHWVICLVIIIVATIGKLVGSMFAARYVGNSWKDSYAIGVLMNTRGLMELIVLNIGYDLGVITPTIFVMMVIMALVTTFATGPLLNLLLKKQEVDIEVSTNPSPILIAFGPTAAGVSLLKLASGILGKNGHIAALHLSPIPENLSISDKEQNKTIFTALDNLAEEKKIHLNKIYKFSDDIVKEISITSKKEQSNLVLMGASKRIFGGNMLGGKVESVLNEVDSTIGIFLDNRLEEIKSVGIFYSDPIESHALYDIASLIYKSSTQKIEIINDSNSDPDRRLIKEHFGKQLPLIQFWELNKKKMNSYSLAIIGYKHWLEIQKSIEKRVLFLGEREEWIPTIHLPILIIRG